jgi:hypothetical protein
MMCRSSHCELLSLPLALVQSIEGAASLGFSAVVTAGACGWSPVNDGPFCFGLADHGGDSGSGLRHEPARFGIAVGSSRIRAAAVSLAGRVCGAAACQQAEQEQTTAQ